jgi:uncharacterized protein YwlG (UPF0340 family)
VAIRLPARAYNEAGVGDLEHRAVTVGAAGASRSEQVTGGVGDQTAEGISSVVGVVEDYQRDGGVAVVAVRCEFKHRAVAGAGEAADICRSEQAPAALAIRLP